MRELEVRIWKCTSRIGAVPSTPVKRLKVRESEVHPMCSIASWGVLSIPDKLQRVLESEAHLLNSTKCGLIWSTPDKLQWVLESEAHLLNSAASGAKRSMYNNYRLKWDWVVHLLSSAISGKLMVVMAGKVLQIKELPIGGKSLNANIFINKIPMYYSHLM